MAPPTKRHSNGVSLAGRLWPKTVAGRVGLALNLGYWIAI